MKATPKARVIVLPAHKSGEEVDAKVEWALVLLTQKQIARIQELMAMMLLPENNLIEEIALIDAPLCYGPKEPRMQGNQLAISRYGHIEWTAIDHYVDARYCTRAMNFERLMETLETSGPITLLELEQDDLSALPCTRIEYDLRYAGGDYDDVGDFFYMPDAVIDRYRWPSTDHDISVDPVHLAFEEVTGINPIHIVNYLTDEKFTLDGEEFEAEEELEEAEA